ATSTTALTSSPNPSTFGQSVTFTATVTTPLGTPTGNVTFLDGGNSLGTQPLGGNPATLTVSTMTPGTHNNTATYNGHSSFTPSTSSPVSQIVNKSGTTTALSPSANPSVFGQSVTFTATVTATSPGAGTPAGTVTFFDGANPVGSNPLDTNGVATLTISSLS